MLTYQALGPLRVMDRNGSLSLGGNNQRKLLAALIAHPDRVVTVSVLAGALWPLDPPRSEHRGVQTVVSRLRRALGTYRADVITEADGYRLAATASNTDLVRFDELTVHARDEPAESALDVLDDALALWRGPAFGSFTDMPVIHLEAIRLDQQRLNTVEDRFQLLLDLGRYPAAIPELEAFVASEPLRERARAQLMQALYWTGRQPDALEVYSSYRGLLGEDLGLEPSPTLRALEEAIVTDALQPATPATGGRARLVDVVAEGGSKGPTTAALEQQGWDRLWELDHTGSVGARQQAYVRLLNSGDRPGAARVAIWLGVNAALRLKNSVAFGWFGRAHQLLEGVPVGSSHGLLLALTALVEILGGHLDEALEHAETAYEIGIGAGDFDVEALGKAMRGWAMLRLGDVKTGMALMDEAMASAVAGELGEYVAALVYCRTLCACLDLMDYQRATEWTDEIANVRDAGGPSDLPGDCRTHRVAVMLMKGDWTAGEREALTACSETKSFDMTHLGLARALLGEIMLRRGDLDEAESQLTAARELGASPYPGLALLRLARDDGSTAASMISESVAEVAHDPLARARLLPAFVEIALARGDLDAAERAAADLRHIADTFRTSALQAYARQASGEVLLAKGDTAGAVRTLRTALRRWRQVGSSYREASVRLKLAEALLKAGRRSDAVAAAETARDTLSELGAIPDVQFADELLTASR